MTKGKLIVACIKLMFDNDTNVLDPDTISDNQEYASRTVNIVESINRALSEVAKAEQLPKKKIVIIPGETPPEETDDYFTKYNLSALATDIMKISNVFYQYKKKYDTNVFARTEEHNTIVLETKTEGKYIITYHPFYTEYLTYDTPDTEEINLAEDIAGIIPFFVKGDLYEEDNPDIALMATNKFHAYLLNRAKPDYSNQPKIKTVHSVW